MRKRWIFLADDGGDWGSGSLSNSQCSVSSLTPSQTSTGVSLSGTITFYSSFAGTQDVYMWAEDNSGGQAGYTQEGTWTVP